MEQCSSEDVLVVKLMTVGSTCEVTVQQGNRTGRFVLAVEAGDIELVTGIDPLIRWLMDGAALGALDGITTMVRRAVSGATIGTPMVVFPKRR